MHNISLGWFSNAVILSVFSILWLPDYLLINPQSIKFISLTAALLLLSFLCRRKPDIAVFLIKGALMLLLFAYAHSQPLKLSELAHKVSTYPQKITTEFVIEEVLRQQDYQSLVVRARLQPELPEQRIYLSWRLNESVRTGERWRGELRLRPISSRLNHGGFDRQQWYFAKRITVWASVKSAVRLTPVFSWRQQWLNAAVQQTEALSQQGLLLALGFGERAWLKQEAWLIYQKTNTAHLIAISGLHIGLAMLFGFMLARLGQILLPTPQITPLLPILCGLGLALIYAQLAGLAIPTFRAIVALFLLYALRLRRMYYSPWQLFRLAVAILLLCDPLMILSVSFWLSVGAVACLILWYQVFPLSLLLWRGKPLSPKVRWIFSLFHLQFGLLWLFTPIQLLIFNGFSLYGFWANLFAVPLFSFVLVPLVLFAIMTQGVCYSWLAADWLAEIITYLLSYMQHQWITLSQTETWLLTVLSVGTFLLVMQWVYRPLCVKKTEFILRKPYLSLKTERNLPRQTQRILTGLGLSLLLSYSGVAAYQNITEADWRLETLDIGQGLATLIVKNGRGILYDTGASWQGGSMAELEIIPYLQRQGIILDKLILSHDDNDHSGGAKEILKAYPAAELITPSYKNYGKTDRTFCYLGQQWHWQGLTFTALSPPAVVEQAENPDSCVLLVDDGKYKILLTGDADVATENAFIRLVEQVDVLQAGHHGSKTSTGSRLVSKFKPKIALISSGRWNPWGFPHPDVVRRLTEARSAVYNTALLGQISLLFRGDNIEVSTARSDFSPWYQRLIGMPNE